MSTSDKNSDHSSFEYAFNSEHIWDFVLKNPDLRLTHPNGTWISFSHHADSTRLEMHISVDEDTTKDQLVEAWDFIREWRSRLSEHQGTEAAWFFAYFRKIKDTGLSYDELATTINAEIEYYVREGYEVLKERGPERPSPTQLVCAAGLMTLMGIDDETKRSWIMDALSNISAGRPVFPPKCPVDASRVRERLRRPPKKLTAVEVRTLFIWWQMEELENEREFVSESEQDS